MIDSPFGLMPDAFRVEVQRCGTEVLIAVGGDLDMATAPHLQAEIERARTSDLTRLVLDLRGLEFMDSTGVVECCRLDARAREDGFSLEIVRGRPAVQRVFALTALDLLLPLVDAPVALRAPG